MNRCTSARAPFGVCVPGISADRCKWCGNDIVSDPKPLARRSDASTSHAAAEAMAGARQTSLKATVIRTLMRRDGLTSGEIADMSGEPHERIWRRVSDLKNDGVIYADGERVWHGRAQQVWRLAVSEPQQVRFA